MDIHSFFQDLTANMGDHTLVLGVVFAAIVVCAVGVLSLFSNKDPVARRLAYGSAGQGEVKAGDIKIRQTNDKAALKGLDRYVTPKEEQKRSSIRRKLAQAGYRRPTAVRSYYLVRIALALSVPVALALVVPFVTRDLGFQKTILITLGGSIVGFYLPAFFLSQRIRARQKAIKDGFPDALDMLLICVEAGLGMDAAINRMTMEIGQAHPRIADEFGLVVAQLRAGKSRMDVLREMANRVSVDEVQAFVSVLSHSDRFGTSISDALRVYAKEMRIKRLVRAEEKANELPVKLSIAVAMFTVPAIILIILAPAIISIARALSSVFNKM